MSDAVDRILQWHEDEESRLRVLATRPGAARALLVSKARWHKEARQMTRLLADSADCMCDGGGSILHTHNPERCTVVRP